MSLTKVVIDRSRWLRGESHSMLLRVSDGKMCCLGFACRAFGVPDSAMEKLTSPQYVHDDRVPKTLIQGNEPVPDYIRTNSNVCQSLMIANDDLSTDDAAREAEIIRLGKDAGLEFEFVGGS